MTAEGFYNARKRLHMRRAPFARALGMSETTAKAYETGTSRIPRYIALAIGALLYGLPEAP